ncbi:MAG: Uma2 family endonuclease, partial [Spirulinaceae cyanobacterium]
TRLLGERALVRQAKPITLPNHSEPEPDLAIVQRLGREYLDHHPYPENIFWVVEYSQTSLDKDKTVKHQLYATAGIPEYWLVNLAQRKLTVWRKPRAGQYTEQRVLSSGTVCPVAFGDVAIASGSAQSAIAVNQIIAP